MTTAKPSIYFADNPRTCTKRQPATPKSQLSEDSFIDEQLPKARSDNIQITEWAHSPLVTPIHSLSTRAAAGPPSVTPSETKIEKSPPLKATLHGSGVAHNLHASIAKLEHLVHEATRLVESALWNEERENKTEAPPSPSQIKSVEPNDQDFNLVQLKTKAAKTLSTRSTALDSIHAATPSIKSVTSLPTVKAAAAEPILTLPLSRSTEDIASTPSKASRADHKARQDDVLEDLHDTACPQSRRGASRSFETQQGTEKPGTSFQPISLIDKDEMQHSTEHSGGPRAICNEKSFLVPSNIAIEESPNMQADSTPTFQLIVEDIDENNEIDFAERHKSHNSVTKLAHQNASIPWRPICQPITSLDPLAGGGIKRTRTGRQPSEPLATKIQQPHATLSSWKGSLLQRVRTGHERHYSTIFGHGSRQHSMNLNCPNGSLEPPKINLKRKSYVDIYHKDRAFNIHDTCHHAPIARNWPGSRKRFTASIACINTSCIGLLIGIYAGEVPAIQYSIADFGHYSILGNVLMYIGLGISSFVFWPLPLLHGRKPYTITANLLALVLQVPQGLAIAGYRDPYVPVWKYLLLISRAISGFALGLSDINLKTTLLDCFGASLQSQGDDPLDQYDVRKHGGGMGMWLGFVSWSTVGPISIGFMMGASIISHGVSVIWGFWASVGILLVVLLFNIVAPEVRRSAFRRTIAEMTGEGGEFSRVTRGEIKMHLTTTGPYWWGEEVFAGLQLCRRMVKQPGFLVLSLYVGWVYAQYNLVLMLIGALASKDYHYKPAYVGLCALAPAIGAVIAAPFQLSSYFSRSRSNSARTDSFTMTQHFKWSSHFIRRLLFMILVPVSAGAYAGSSVGPPLLVAAPCVMAGLVGLFTTMATTECYGLIMETFDTSDLQPGMTGRPLRGSVDVQTANQRTNFSCYPRVSAGFAVTQAVSYILAACATAVCGRVERKEGTVWATTGVAIISLILTLLLLLVLVKWKKLRMIPDGPADFDHIRRADTSWRPVNVGRGSGKFRRLSILEMGKLTRYSEIRQRNRVGGSLSGGLRCTD